MATIFVLGGSGYIGGALVRELAAQGHSAVVLSRRAALQTDPAQGDVRLVRGSLEDVDLIRREAAASDGVVYAPDFAPNELEVLAAICESLNKPAKPLIFVSGASMVSELTAGDHGDKSFDEFAEVDPPKPIAFRLGSEKAVLESPLVRGVVVRPPIVFGDGGSRQIPMMEASAQKTGAVHFVGAGENRWGYIHVRDLARFIAATVTRPVSGIFHATAGEVAFGDIARAIGDAIGLPAASWSLDEASEGYGKFPARIALGSSSRLVDTRARAELDWTAREPDILTDIRVGSYKQKWSRA